MYAICRHDLIASYGVRSNQGSVQDFSSLAMTDFGGKFWWRLPNDICKMSGRIKQENVDNILCNLLLELVTSGHLAE